MNWILAAIFAMFVLWAAYLYWNYRSIRKEAVLVFGAARDRREFPANEPFEPFDRAFLKTSGIRVGIYRFAASLTAVIMLPVMVSFLNFIWVRLYYMFRADQVFAEGNMVHSFYLAVGSMAGLVLIAGLYARAYHLGRKNDFEGEWEAEKRRSASSHLSAH